MKLCTHTDRWHTYAADPPPYNGRPSGYLYIYIVVVAYRLAQAVSTCITYQGHGLKFPPKDVRPLAPSERALRQTKQLLSPTRKSKRSCQDPQSVPNRRPKDVQKVRKR